MSIRSSWHNIERHLKISLVPGKHLIILISCFIVNKVALSMEPAMIGSTYGVIALRCHHYSTKAS